MATNCHTTTVCNIMARKPADRKGGGPRYELCYRAYTGVHIQHVSRLILLLTGDYNAEL
jgi:hypothetical protein